jgi:hypothetical protein
MIEIAILTFFEIINYLVLSFFNVSKSGRGMKNRRSADRDTTTEAVVNKSGDLGSC